MENALWVPAVGQKITFSVLLQTPCFRLSLLFYEATHKCSVGLSTMQVSNIFMLQMMESHHSPLSNAFGMAVCSNHDMFLINSGPKIPKKLTKTFLFFFLNYSHLFDTGRKKRSICIPNFNRVQLLGDPFLEKVNSHELHSLNMAQYKH